MGGRLVPSFTRNWMARQGIRPEPAPPGRLDLTIVGLAGLAIGLWVLLPLAPSTGVALALAGAALLIRLGRWRGWMTIREGMVLILHVGYFWCALGLLLLGASVLLPGAVPASAAIHALTTGGIGVMTLAVMTRTTRSHTGRERRADSASLAIYGLINAAALTRVAAPFIGAIEPQLLIVSSICWSLAFGWFVLAYGPMLVRPWHRAA